jgi:hypothetical protein
MEHTAETVVSSFLLLIAPFGYLYFHYFLDNVIAVVSLTSIQYTAPGFLLLIYFFRLRYT